MTRSRVASSTDSVSQRDWVALSIAALVTTMDVSIVNIGFVDIASSFSSESDTDSSWIVNGYTIGLASTLLIGGRLADRFGAEVAFRRGILLFMVASIACAVAPNQPVLIFGRIAQGAAAGAITPAALSQLISMAGSENRIRWVTRFAGMGAVGTALGPTVGALMIHLLGWRSAFAINIPLLSLSLLLSRGFATTPSAQRGRPLNLPVVAMFGALLSIIAFVLTDDATWSQFTGRPLVLSMIALALLVAILLSSRRLEDPIVALSLFRGLAFSRAAAAYLLFNSAFACVTLGVAIFLRSVIGMSVLAAGLTTVWGSVTVALLASQAGRMARRFGFRAALLTGAALYLAGLGALQIAAQPDAKGIHFVPCVLLLGCGVAFIFPVLSAASVHGLDRGIYGEATGLAATLRQIGGVVGVAILALTLERRGTTVETFKTVWAFSTLPVIAMALVATTLSTTGARDSNG